VGAALLQLWESFPDSCIDYGSQCTEQVLTQQQYDGSDGREQVLTRGEGIHGGNKGFYSSRGQQRTHAGGKTGSTMQCI